MKTKLLLALIAGSTFCINIAEANIPLRADGSPAAGQTPTQFIQLKMNVLNASWSQLM